MTASRDLQQSERIDILDRLRGFALLGIFLINIPGLAEIRTGIQPALKSFLSILIEDSARPLFAAMFGISMVLIYDRMQDKNKNPYPLLFRRLLILGMVGALHGFAVWAGDILLKFAMAGFVLLFFLKLKNKWLLIFGLAFWLLYTVGTDMFNYYSSYHFDMSVLLMEIFSFGSHLRGYEYILNEAAVMAAHLGFFLLGMHLYRAGIFTSAAVSRKKTWMIASILFIAGLAGKTGLFYGVEHPLWNGMDYFYPFILTIGVLLGVVLWGTSRRPVSQLLLPFESIGRMTFTNYLLQSLVFVTLFGSGRTIFAEIGFWNDPPYLFALTAGLILFTIQMIFSWLWLKKFYYGPFEWLWRIGTHGKIVPLTRKQKVNNRA